MVPSSAAKELSGIRITRLVCVTIGKPLASINDGGGSTEFDAVPNSCVHTSKKILLLPSMAGLYTCVCVSYCTKLR